MKTINHKLGGQDRKFRFTYSAISDWCRMENIPLASMETMFANIDLKAVSTLLFWGYKKANDDDVTLREFEDWLDEAGGPEVMELFAKAGEQLNSFWQVEDKGEAKKKKPASTK